MTSDNVRLVVAIAVVALIVGLIAYARGADHHHGMEVGQRPHIASSLIG
jgi:hypothetical protein